MRWNSQPEINAELELEVYGEILPLKFYRERYDAESGEPVPLLQIECYKPILPEMRLIIERKFWRWYHKTYGR